MPRKILLLIPILAIGVAIVFFVLRKSGDPGAPLPTKARNLSGDAKTDVSPSSGAPVTEVVVLDVGSRKPISGARVRLATATGSHSTTTDSNGSCHVSVASSSLRSILAEKDGYIMEYRKLQDGTPDRIEVPMHAVQTVVCRFGKGPALTQVTGSVRIDCLACWTSAAETQETLPPWEFTLAQAKVENASEVRMELQRTICARARIVALLERTSAVPREVRFTLGQGLMTVDLDLEPPGDCRGRVLNEDSQPIARASVRLEQNGFSQEFLTNPAGEFAFSGVRRDELDVSAWAAGYQPLRLKRNLQTDASMDLVLKRADEIIIKGRVIDEFRAPVPSAKVESAHSHTETDTSGAFELRIPGLTARTGMIASITASKSGYADAGRYAIRLPTDEITLILYRGARLNVIANELAPGQITIKIQLIHPYVVADKQTLGRYTRGYSLVLSQKGEYPQESLLPGLYQLTVQSESGERAYFAEIHGGLDNKVEMK